MATLQLDELARRLWECCILPAARYDLWLPSEAAADAQGYMDAVVTPVFKLAGRRCAVMYWTDGRSEMWRVALESGNGMARHYVFGDAWQAPEDSSFDWTEQAKERGRAVWACPLELAEQLSMAF